MTSKTGFEPFQRFGRGGPVLDRSAQDRHSGCSDWSIHLLDKNLSKSSCS